MRVGKTIDRGKALLETDFLLFRGAGRLAIPLAEVRAAQANDGVLVVQFGAKTASFELGRRAEAWAAKITKPKGALEKLGLTGGARVALVGDFDDAFRAAVVAVGARATMGAKGTGYDHVLFAAERVSDLARVEKLAKLLLPRGGLWIVYPKGKKEPGAIREADVLARGRAAGLKDVKVMRFSETHTGLRFVIPRAARGGARSAKAKKGG